MKKILAAIATAAFAIYPSICSAAYIIHLKNGRELVTERYWEEGGQIKFTRYGGVIGIQKDLVKNIEEIEDLPREKVKEAPTMHKGPETTEKMGAREDVVVKEESTGGKTEHEKAIGKKKKESEKEEKKIDIAHYQRQKRALLEKQREAQEKYRKALDTGDKATQRQVKRELKEIDKKMSELALKLIEENSGIVPGWWHEIRLERAKNQ